MVVASSEIRGRQMTRFCLPIGNDLNSISSTHFVCVREGIYPAGFSCTDIFLYYMRIIVGAICVFDRLIYIGEFRNLYIFDFEDVLGHPMWAEWSFFLNFISFLLCVFEYVLV